MNFEDIVAVLGQAFGLELKVVQDTTVFEVVSDDGSTKVSIPRRLQRVARRAFILPVVLIALFAASAFAEGGYTNHAGNVVAGWPVKLTQKEVSLAEGVVTNGCQLSTDDCRLTTSDNNFSTFQPFNFSTTNTYPLSIFPESEQRRIAADFGQPRVPVAVKRAITGAEKAMARSRKRAAKGLCSQEESDAFCEKSEAALRSYLDKQVESGTLTPAERTALDRSRFHRPTDRDF